MTGPGSAPLLDREALGVLARYARPRRASLSLYVLAASAQSLLALPTLALVRAAFDEAIPRGDVRGLARIGVGLLLLRLLAGGVQLALRWWALRLIKGTVADLRGDLLARLLRVSRGWLGRADLAHLHTRVVHDTERVDHLINALLSSLLPSAVAALVLGAVLLRLDWRLVLLLAAAGPALWLAGRLSGRRVKGDVRVFQRAFEGFSKGVHFVLRHMDLVRLRAYEEGERARQAALVGTLRDTGRRMAMSYARHTQVQRAVTGVAGVTILVVGGMAVAGGRLTLGQLLQFYLAAGMLHGYVDAVLGGVPELIAGGESLLTLQRLLEDGEEEPYRGGAARAFDGGVAFERVSFSYGRSAVLRDVSLEIPPGANVVITGANGAGKSTLMHLLLGFYRPDAGRVLADGRPYDALDVRALRRRVGVVPQHPTFFPGTVRENVAYGAPDVVDAELEAAARLASADELLARLPAGWDTEIGERGLLLSGGERQRLAIARALLGAPRLLVLDEPTTHLDVDTVRAVMGRLVEQPSRPTLVTISHDPAVVACADVVYRLEGGLLHAVAVDAVPAELAAP